MSAPSSPYAHWKQAYLLPLGWWQAQFMRNLPGEGNIDVLKERIKNFEGGGSKRRAEYRPWKRPEKQFSKKDFEEQNSAQNLKLWESLSWHNKFAKDPKRMLEETFTPKVLESDRYVAGTDPTKNTQIPKQRNLACFFFERTLSKQQ